MKQKDILSFFNLEGHPFSKEIKTQDLACLPTLEKAQQELELLLETRGIGLFTGPSGSGKSSLIRKIASEMNPGLYRPFYICHTSLGTAEFYQGFAAALGLTPKGRRNTAFRSIRDFIIDLNDQQRIHPVIIIDEAHQLSSDTLKEFRMLTNFDYDSKNACTLILCGHCELRQKLSLNVFTSLANAITYSIRLDALPAEETCSYIEHGVMMKKGNSGLFTPNAMKLIHDFSGGILRVTANAAWQSLIKAYEHKSNVVEKEHVQMVISH